jgi:hypothetical protein
MEDKVSVSDTPTDSANKFVVVVQLIVLCLHGYVVHRVLAEGETKEEAPQEQANDANGP